MGFLTKEDKDYLLRTGSKWDGKTVHDRTKDINKKCREAFDDIIWIMENMQSIRRVTNVEFKSKYGDPSKTWEGKGAPKRSTVTGHKFVTKDQINKFLELYIKESIDQMYYDPWLQGEQGSVYRKKLTEEVGKMKEELIDTISGVEVKIT